VTFTAPMLSALSELLCVFALYIRSSRSSASKVIFLVAAQPGGERRV
jgi:hypothetical protein